MKRRKIYMCASLYVTERKHGKQLVMSAPVQDEKFRHQLAQAANTVAMDRQIGRTHRRDN